MAACDGGTTRKPFAPSVCNQLQTINDEQELAKFRKAKICVTNYYCCSDVDFSTEPTKPTPVLSNDFGVDLLKNEKSRIAMMFAAVNVQTNLKELRNAETIGTSIQ